VFAGLRSAIKDTLVRTLKADASSVVAVLVVAAATTKGTKSTGLVSATAICARMRER